MWTSPVVGSVVTIIPVLDNIASCGIRRSRPSILVNAVVGSQLAQNPHRERATIRRDRDGVSMRCRYVCKVGGVPQFLPCWLGDVPVLCQAEGEEFIRSRSASKLSVDLSTVI